MTYRAFRPRAERQPNYKSWKPLGISSLPWLLLKTIKTEHLDLLDIVRWLPGTFCRMGGGGKGREVGSQRPWRD